MNQHERGPTRCFALRPFGPAVILPWRVTGTIERRRDTLTIVYALTGSLDQLVLPGPAERPQRRDNLWRESCFEFFVAGEGAEGYQEVNLSPAGDWNVYCFDRYRQGMRQAESAVPPCCRIARQGEDFTLEARLDLAGLVGGGPLLVGVSAVLLAENGALSYWALAHPGERPDFHDPRGFLLRL